MLSLFDELIFKTDVSLQKEGGSFSSDENDEEVVGDNGQISEEAIEAMAYLPEEVF